MFDTQKTGRKVIDFYLILKEYCLEHDIGDIVFSEGDYPYLVDGSKNVYTMILKGKDGKESEKNISDYFNYKYKDNPGVLDGADMYSLFKDLEDYSILKDLEKKYEEELGVDFAIKHEGTKLRCNCANRVGKNIEIVSRVIVSKEAPTLEKLGLVNETNNIYKNIVQNTEGLILVVGPTGSGKSTTLVAMIDEINTTSKKRILTFEDPVEFEHTNKMSKIVQKEVKVDVQSYAHGLHLALRQKPHVAIVGEARDGEVVKLAMELASTGHLVMTTFHSKTVTQTISRIEQFYAESEREGFLSDLADVILGIFVQRLIPKKGGGKILLRETLIGTKEIKRAIAKRDYALINGYMRDGSSSGMVQADQSLEALYNADLIDDNTLFIYAQDKKWAEEITGKSYN